MWLSSAMNRLRELDFARRIAGGNDNGREIVGRKTWRCQSGPRGHGGRSGVARPRMPQDSSVQGPVGRIRHGCLERLSW